MKEGKYNYPVSRRSCLHFLLLSFALAGCKRDAPADARPWSEEVWEKAGPVYERILAHPFIQEMAAGTLPEARFARYIAQDEVYIGAYGKLMYELAAMLPCIWIYNCVGLYILEIADLEGNPYREWIEAYVDEAYTKEVEVMLETIDTWMEEVDAGTRAVMTDMFLESMQYEYAFWDYGYYGDGKDYSYVR